MLFIFMIQLNLDRLLAKMWDEMGLVRVYTKPQGQQPDFTDPVVLSAVCYFAHHAGRFSLLPCVVALEISVSDY